jgi:hypothetical protein
MNPKRLRRVDRDASLFEEWLGALLARHQAGGPGELGERLVSRALFPNDGE